MDVQLAHWPEESGRRNDLAAAGRTRLLLVAADADPPVSDSPEEDWIRLPATPADLQARLQGLERHAATLGLVVPQLGDDQVLRFRGAVAPLPDVEYRLVTVLLERAGAVASRDQLRRAGWPDERASSNTLDVQMGRLRRRLASVDLHIRTVRGRGYLLEMSS